VGLCTYLINAGMKMAAYYSFRNYPGIGNGSWMKAKELIKAAYPLVKKKIMIRYYGIADWRSLIANGFDPYPRHYMKLIKKVVPGIDLDELLVGLRMHKPFKAEIKFYVIAFLSLVYRYLKRTKQFIKRIIYRGAPERYMTVAGSRYKE
jgi:hypothetical protein